MIAKDKRIIFMGTPRIAARVLESLILDGFNIVALIAQEDKPVGRKGILEPVPTKVVALAHNIPIYQPHRIRKEFEFINELKPDLILTMAYGQIVPHDALMIPIYGCLNLHGSLLPKYRGAAPIQRAIINGDKVTGVTLMEMVDKMDAGKMFAKEEIVIEQNDTYSSLCEKMSIAGANICKNYLDDYFLGKLPGEEQNETEVTFAEKILPNEERLNINLDTNDFLNYINGLSNEPGGYVMLNDKKLKILKAHKIEGCGGNIGKLTITKTISLELKDGVIVLDEVHLEGKKQMDGKSFANGNKMLDGVIIK